ncbi:MAG: cytochrome b/b6 domain-containing protein [Novosphingobium sp.]|nr:cytochrome b/b6 domain-containing protein [Novosphingobium sp.]
MSKGIRVWDLPTRLFHWLLVGLLSFSWWSAQVRAMEWHLYSGMLVLGLLVFRLVWGVIGGSTARFGNFLVSPARALAHWRAGRNAPVRAGHNPLGGYSVIAMLGLLMLQVATGCFASDIDGLDSGPLSFLVSFEQSRRAAELHETSFNLLLALIVLHVLAVLFYRYVRGRRLLLPMVTGHDTQLDANAGTLEPASPFALIIALACAIGLTFLVWSGFFL